MSEASRPSLSAFIQGELGGQLRALHDEVVKEDIPERFVVLLKRLNGTETLSRAP